MDDATKATLDFAREIDFSDILTNPILDIGARVWEDDRYAAFRVTYRSMRRIDDLVDERRESGEPVTPEEIAEYHALMQDWLDKIAEGNAPDEFSAEFLRTVERFRIPLWPWERLCKAMFYDLSHNGYRNFLHFLRYCEGAAIAPAAVFTHMCGVRLKGDTYEAPEYDIRLAARPLALFSYLVHIMRDFEKDQKAGLNYYSDDILQYCSLKADDLPRLDPAKPTPELRQLIGVYKRLAGHYRELSRTNLDRLFAYLGPRYRLSLELIYDLYLQIYQRVKPDDGQFSGSVLNPNPEEIERQIQSTISTFSK